MNIDNILIELNSLIIKDLVMLMLLIGILSRNYGISLFKLHLGRLQESKIILQSDLIKIFPIKAFKKLKKSKLHIDKELYIEARNSVSRTIKRKKESFIKNELAENINEPKKLWKTIKSLGLPSKMSSSAKICLKEKNNVIFEPKLERKHNFFINKCSQMGPKLAGSLLY